MPWLRGPDLGPYRLQKCLHQSAEREIYAATRERDAQPVVLKVYPEGGADGSPAEREFDALRRVAGPGIPAALELLREGGWWVLAQECVAGVTLPAWVRNAAPEPEVFLWVAIQLTEVLARVHSARLLHRNVTPHNAIIDPASLRCHLIGFGCAQPLGSVVQPRADRPEVQKLRDTLPYISPEQSGRMDRGVDSRSDLYSLGATFYFALTSRPPFDGDDPLALIHAHMAKVPPPPSELSPRLPGTLSRIVVKLLQKDPEARYQTAGALQRDLEECRAQLRDLGRIEDDFPLGTADAPFRPLFSKRLYGRADEIRTLLDAYALAQEGRTTVLLLKGSPGAGKSALANELRVPLAKSNGYLAAGKFDLYRRETPYAGFVQAFESIVQQILTESDAHLARWRSELKTVLGPSAGVLVELIGDLAIVLGDVQAVPALGPAETRARLGLAVERLVFALATREHPLVLFLDDLQWADAGSRELLSELLGNVRNGALLLLGSYRDTEVGPDHPLAALIRDLERRGIALGELAIRPLTDGACAEMLAEALGRAPAETRSLASCVGRKTGHTPLLIQQFIYHMYDLGLISFQAPLGWTWDEAALAAAEIPDDAVGFMTAKLARLPVAVVGVLQLASCVGDRFDLETLAALTERPRAVIESALFSLCDEGLIAPAHGGFRFVHDRIREAAQAQLSSGEREQLHYQAARLLLDRTAHEAVSGHAVQIADHLNLCRDHLDEREQLRAIELNVLAGKTALGAGAAATAAHYFQAGRALFRQAHWDTHPKLGFELFLQAAESAYQMQEIELALELLAPLEARPLTTMQTAEVVAKAIMTRSLAVRGEADLDRAGTFVLDALRRFGVRWPRHPSRLRTKLALLRMEWTLRRPLGEHLFPPASAGDPSAWLAPLVVMVAGAPALDGQTVRLVCLLTCHVLAVFLRQGYTNGSGLAIAGYASHRLAFLKHLEGAERYAQAALEWNQRVPHPIYSGRTSFVVYAFIYSWTRPRRTILEPLRKTMEQCREVGDISYAYYVASQRALQAALAGETLPRVLADCEAMGAMSVAEAGTMARLEKLILGLLRTSSDDAEQRAQVSWIQTTLADMNRVGRAAPGALWLEVLCLLGKYAEASATAAEISGWISEVGCMGSYVVDFYFFWGMASAETALAIGSRSRRVGFRRRDATLRQCLRRLRIWARHGPDFGHMAEALQAERHRLRGRRREALALYVRSQQHAIRQGYPQHAAFLGERRAHLLLALDREAEAAAAFQQAIDLYTEWGASAKAQTLASEARTLTGRATSSEAAATS